MLCVQMLVRQSDDVSKQLATSSRARSAIEDGARKLQIRATKAESKGEPLYHESIVNKGQCMLCLNNSIGCCSANVFELLTDLRIDLSRAPLDPENDQVVDFSVCTEYKLFFVLFVNTFLLDLFRVVHGHVDC